MLKKIPTTGIIIDSADITHKQPLSKPNAQQQETEILSNGGLQEDKLIEWLNFNYTIKSPVITLNK